MKLAITYRPPASIRGSARNARTHSAEQVAEIAASIQRFGFASPILVDSAGEIIAGHGRLAAAQSLGLAEVPVISLDGLSPAEVRALRLADNQLALNAGWDEALLRSELLDLRAEDFDVEILGFDDEELGRLLDDVGPLSSGGRPDTIGGDPSGKPKAGANSWAAFQGHGDDVVQFRCGDVECWLDSDSGAAFRARVDAAMGDGRSYREAVLAVLTPVLWPPE